MTVYVLDTSFATRVDSLDYFERLVEHGDKLIMPSRVIPELEGRISPAFLRYLQTIGTVYEFQPDRNLRGRIGLSSKNGCDRKADSSGPSQTDIQIIAIALVYASLEHQVVILSNDEHILAAIRGLGIKAVSVEGTEGIIY